MHNWHELMEKYTEMVIKQMIGNKRSYYSVSEAREIGGWAAEVAGSALATMHFLGDTHESRVRTLHRVYGTLDPCKKNALQILDTKNRGKIVRWLQENNCVESEYNDACREFADKEPLTLEEAMKLMEEQINRDFPEEEKTPETKEKKNDT